jgi:hypothetical protein
MCQFRYHKSQTDYPETEPWCQKWKMSALPSSSSALQPGVGFGLLCKLIPLLSISNQLLQVLHLEHFHIFEDSIDPSILGSSCWLWPYYHSTINLTWTEKNNRYPWWQARRMSNINPTRSILRLNPEFQGANWAQLQYSRMAFKNQPPPLKKKERGGAHTGARKGHDMFIPVTDYFLYVHLISYPFPTTRWMFWRT